MRAVRYDRFGGVDVLAGGGGEPPGAGGGEGGGGGAAPPVRGPDEVLVAVRAVGINPGEAKIREGAYAERWPTAFPSGQGSDLAGVVDALGPGVTGWAPGDEVIGWVDDRSSQSELVAVPVGQVARKPDGLPWEQAGALH